MPPPVSSISTNNRSLNIALVNTWRVVDAKGGTEKVFCDMANAFVDRGHKVSAICIDPNKGVPGFHLDSRVQFINAYYSKIPFTLSKTMRKYRALSLSASKRRQKRAHLTFEANVYAIKSALRDSSPDVIICFQPTTTETIKQIVGNSVPIVTMLHFTPKAMFPKGTPDSLISAVSSSNAVQVLRPEFALELAELMPDANIVTIPNCVPQFQEDVQLTTPTIINVGRVCREKRQVLLAQAFALIKDQFPNWKVELWGETHCDIPYTMQLEKTIKELGLEDCIICCGATNDVPQHLKQASIFVFPSEHEGFGLALTEAMAMGLPSIGCKNCSAVNTLIRNELNGLLCEDSAESLAKALVKLMQNKELRQHYGRVAKQDMKQFAPERIWDQWESLLYSLTL